MILKEWILKMEKSSENMIETWKKPTDSFIHFCLLQKCETKQSFYCGNGAIGNPNDLNNNSI